MEKRTKLWFKKWL